MTKVVTPRSASASRSHQRGSERDALSEHFFSLNEQFGEIVDGKATTVDDFITDPHELAKYQRPSDEEIREAVTNGLRRQG